MMMMMMMITITTTVTTLIPLTTVLTLTAYDLGGWGGGWRAMNNNTKRNYNRQLCSLE
jgi:hypothetical protein